MRDSREMFQREYLCKWTSSKAYEEAYKQYIAYEYKCESYDRSSHPCEVDQYGYFKMFGEEWRLSNINAMQHHKEMMCEIQRYNASEKEKITSEILQKARQEVRRLTWIGVQNEYKRLFRNVEI